MVGGKRSRRELFHRRNRTTISPGACRHCLTRSAMPVIEGGEIGLHGPGFECDRPARAPVQPMLVEIEQHQAARENSRPQDRSPAHGSRRTTCSDRRGRSSLASGPQYADAGFAEHAAAIDEAVFSRPSVRLRPWGPPGPTAWRPITGQPSSPGNVRQRGAFGWGSELRLRERPHFASTIAVLRLSPIDTRIELSLPAWQFRDLSLNRLTLAVTQCTGPFGASRPFAFAASFCRSGALTVGIANAAGPGERKCRGPPCRFSMIFAITAWPARLKHRAVFRPGISVICANRRL